MPHEGAIVRVASITYAALEGFVFKVGALMSLHGMAHGETPSTVFTNEGLAASVGAFMAPHGAAFGEGSTTVLTDERLFTRMHSSMAFKVTNAGKYLLTNMALEFRVICVGLFMLTQVPILTENLPTE